MPVVLITGPVRSGKSTLAQRLAAESGRRVTYIATAQRERDDAEWNARIERHRQERPTEWRTLETAGMAHADVLAVFERAAAGEVLVVEALGTWISARISSDIEAFERDTPAFETALETEANALIDAMRTCAALVIVVGEQVGWDVVPVVAAARVFRDVLGRMQQRIGGFAERAYLVVAGFALDLRALGTRVQ